MNQLIKYIKATNREMKQVAWPTQRQAVMYTILVIAISAVIAAYIGAFDYLFSQVISSIVEII